jgi:polyhydroxyalkanoate synthesis regulator phasin
MIQETAIKNDSPRNEAVLNVSFKVRLLMRSIAFYKRQMEVLEELLKEWNFHDDSIHHKEDVTFFLLQLGRCKMELSRKESSLVMIANRGYRLMSKQDTEAMTKLLTRISRQVNQLENEIAELNKQIRNYLIDFAS